MATVAKGYDLDYAWRAVGEAYRGAGYYLAAAEAGEPPGTWWGPGAERLGFAEGQQVEREPYDLLFGQRKGPDGRKLGRAPANAGKAGEIYKGPAGRRASMFSNPDLSDIVGYAARTGVKVAMALDHQQLQAVENGGGRGWSPALRGMCSFPSRCGSARNGSARRRWRCARARSPRWRTTPSTGGCGQERPRRSWRPPSGSTSPPWRAKTRR